MKKIITTIRNIFSIEELKSRIITTLLLLVVYRVGTFIVEQGISMPTWPSYFVLPIGFGLLALILFYRMVIIVSGLTSGLGEEPMEGANASEKV